MTPPGPQGIFKMSKSCSGWLAMMFLRPAAGRLDTLRVCRLAVFGSGDLI